MRALLDLVIPSRQRRQGQRVPPLLSVPVMAGCCLLAATTTAAGYLDFEPAAWFMLWSVLQIAVFGAALHSGANRRFDDPTLAMPQLLACGIAITYLVYAGGDARPVFIAMYLIALMTATLWLDLRRLALLATVYLACYGLVVMISLKVHVDVDVRRELFRIVGVALLFTGFSLVGGYVSRLRRELEVANARLRSSLDQAETLARVDSLTGCYNRRRGLELLEIECSRAARGSALTVALADIDHFKSINDQAGHATGDAVLRDFARCVQNELRATDFLVRYGGEEFLIVFSQTPLEGAVAVAERIRQSTSAIQRPGGKPLTVSVGVAEHQRSDKSAATIARADLALYRAKNAGRNRVVRAGDDQAAAA